MHAGETRIYLALLTGLLVLVVFIAVFIITITRYHRKQMAFQRERVRVEINALEKERNRIATDLHDDFGASLSAIKLRLQCLEPGNEKNSLLAQQCEFYIDEAMVKLRRISFNMMPRILYRKGLTEALEELMDILVTGAGIKLNFRCEVDPADIQKRVHMYRIVQEVINNSVTHAKATVINFSMEKVSKKIMLHITDNGIGFNKTAVQGIKGEGLQNIMARAEILDATIHLITEPGKGVDYLFEIPAEYD